MTTSGVTTLSYTARGLITDAFLLHTVVAAGTELPARLADVGLVHLNLLLKGWSLKPHLFLTSEGTVPLVAATASYALPSTVRKLIGVRRRTANIDTPLTELSREEYMDFPTKSGAGMPVNYFVDRQASVSTLYVWSVPTAAIAANTTLTYSYERRIEVITDLSQTLDLPEEWQEALLYNLAVRLIPSYGVDSNTNQDIRDQAAASLALVIGDDQEGASLFMSPAGPYGR